MAQIGLHKTIISASLDKLGQLSGSHGLIGAVIEGFSHDPMVDKMDFETTEIGIVIDKVNIVSNLPNRTHPDEIKNLSNVTEFYVCLQLTESEAAQVGEAISTGDFTGRTIIYIPTQYVTRVHALPLVECCDADAPVTTAPFLEVVPEIINFGTLVSGATSPSQIFTVNYSGVVSNITVDDVTPNNGGFFEISLDGTTWITATTQLVIPLSTVITSGGTLTFYARYKPTGAVNATHYCPFVVSANSGSLTDTCMVQGSLSAIAVPPDVETEVK